MNGMPAAANPFDPDLITLDLEVTPPPKKLTVPGFSTRSRRKLERGREVLAPRGEGEWRVRSLPLEPGRHTWSRPQCSQVDR